MTEVALCQRLEFPDPRFMIGSKKQDDQQRFVLRGQEERFEQLQRTGIGPMQIVKSQHQRLFPCQGLHEGAKSCGHAAVECLRLESMQPIGVLRGYWRTQQEGYRRPDVSQPLVEEWRELLLNLQVDHGRRVKRVDMQQLAQEIADHAKRLTAAIGRCLPPGPGDGRPQYPGVRLMQQPALPDSGLPDQGGDCAPARLQLLEQSI